MELILLIVCAGLIYCLCELSKLKKKDGQNLDAIEYEKKQDRILRDRMSALKGKMVELEFKEIMISLNLISNVKCIILDLDEEWVLISCQKREKEIRKCFRCQLVKEVKEMIEN